MSELKEQFERLMDFARERNFHKPFSKVCFVEDKSIQYYRSDKIIEIPQQEILSFENYENRFNEILNQGYSWINMNFAGMFGGALLIVIEVPDYKNNAEFTSINLSLPNPKVVKNDLNLLPFLKSFD